MMKGTAFILSILVALMGDLASGCGANETVLKSGKETPAANRTPALANIEADIEEMRTADFDFIFVIRRKDGAPIDDADRAAIRAQTEEANRRISSENGKAVVVGSNFLLPGEKMRALYGRFAIENFSKPGAEALDSGANTNMTANSNAKPKTRINNKQQ